MAKSKLFSSSFDTQEKEFNNKTKQKYLELSGWKPFSKPVKRKRSKFFSTSVIFFMALILNTYLVYCFLPNNNLAFQPRVAKAAYSGKSLKTIEVPLGGGTDNVVRASATTVYAGSSWNTATSSAGSFNVKLLGTGIEIQSAYLETTFTATSTASITDVKMVFNTSPGTMAPNYLVPVDQPASGITHYVNSGVTAQMESRGEVTGLLDALNDSQWNAGVNVYAGLSVTGPTFTASTMKLIITYDEAYSLAANSVKTVRFPLDSTGSATTTDSGARQAACAQNTTCSFKYLATMPDLAANADIYAAWFEIRSVTDAATVATGTPQINGGTAGTMLTDGETTADTRDSFYIFKPSIGGSDFNPNVQGQLDFLNGTTSRITLGGELVVTYKYATSAATQTDTVRYLMGQETTAGGTATTTYTQAVSIANGGLSVKNAWFKIHTANSSALFLTVQGKIGSSASSTNVYTMVGTNSRAGESVVYHDLGNATSSFSSATTTVIAALKRSTATGDAQAGVELYVTFTWSGSGGGNQTKTVLFNGGTNQGTTNVTNESINSNFTVTLPETVTKIQRSTYMESTMHLSKATTISLGTLTQTINGTSSLAFANTTDTEAFKFSYFQNVTNSAFAAAANGGPIAWTDNSFNVGQSYSGTTNSVNYTNIMVVTYEAQYPLGGATFSGVFYDTDEATNLGAGIGLRLAVAAATIYDATTTTGGIFSINVPSIPASGTVITIFANTSGATQGSMVFKYGASCTGDVCSNIGLIKNAVVLDNKHTGSMTNADLAACDNDTGAVCADTDIGFTSNAGALSVTFSSDKLKIISGATFAPGGNVTTQKLDIEGTYNGNTETLALTGSGTDSNCASSVLMPMCVTGTFNASTSTVSFRGTATTSVPSLNYYNLDFSPASGAPNYIFGTVNSSGWYNISWAHRKTIIIDHNKIASSTNESYANFPVLISRTDPDLESISNGGYVASSTGADILFTSSDGTTKLNHELEKYSSSTGETIAWVSLPSLSTSTDTTLYMYFGNSSSTLASQASSTAVWDNNYKAVYHLPDGTTLSGNDSTSNANNGTLNSVTVTSGQIDGAASFAGTDASKISKATNATLNTGGSFTLEAWVNASNYTSFHDIITKTTSGGITGNYYLETNGTELYCGFWNGSGFLSHESSGASLSTSAWYHLACVFDEPNNTMKGYKNGAEIINVAEAGIPQSNASDLLYVGGGYTAEGFPGKIDEARVSLATRSADWIKTSYNNQSSTTTFYSVSSLASRTSNPINVGGDLTTGGSGNPVVDVDTYNPALSILGSLSIATGDSFLASDSATTTIDHNFTNNGSFTHNNGTIQFGSTTQTSIISSTATTTFYNLVIITPGKTINFQKATVYVPVFSIANNFIVTGSNGSQVVIQSDTAGSQWLVYLSIAQSNLNYAYIKDSGCFFGSANATVTNGGNGGNNSSCWLGLPAIVGAVDYSGGTIYIGGGGGVVIGGGGVSGGDGSVDGGGGGGGSVGGGGAGGGGGGAAP